MDVPTTGQFIPPGGNTEISGTGYQIPLAEVDPTTGLPRLIAGNLDGLYSGLDNNGVVRGDDRHLRRHARRSIATATSSSASSTTARPSPAARRPRSPRPCSTAAPRTSAARPPTPTCSPTATSSGAPGRLRPRASTTSRPRRRHGRRHLHIASGTAVDQQGTGTLFQFWSPGQGGGYTNFVMVNGVGRTFELLQASNGLPTARPAVAAADRATPTSSSTRSTATTC